VSGKTPRGYYTQSNTFSDDWREKIGPAIWLYLYLYARANRTDGTYTVCLQEYADERKMHHSVVKAWKKRLQECGAVEFTVVKKGSRNSHLAYRVTDYYRPEEDPDLHVLKTGPGAEEQAPSAAPQVLKTGPGEGEEDAPDALYVLKTGPGCVLKTGPSQVLKTGPFTIPSTLPSTDKTTAPRVARRSRAEQQGNTLFPAEMITPPAPVSPENEAIGAIHAVLLTDGTGRFPRWRERVQKRDLERRVRQWVEDGATPDRVREAIADPTTQTMQGVFALVGRWPKGRPQWGAKRTRNGQGKTNDAPIPPTQEVMDALYGTSDTDNYWDIEPDALSVLSTKP